MKISVILPNFNHAAFLAQAIEGVLSQTYQDWQLCVVDDGSTDDSWAIIERYRDRDARIVAERSPRNCGVIPTIRRCVELCTGELLCPIAADDYLSNPRFFELGVAALQRFPQAAGAVGRGMAIDGKDDRQLSLIGPNMPARRARGGAKKGAAEIPMRFIPPQEALTNFVSHQMPIPGCSVILRRALMAEIGDYDEALGPQSDYYLNHALALLHGVVFIDTPVAAMRMSDSTYSGSASKEDYFRRNSLIEKKLRALALPCKMDERMFAQLRMATINCRTSGVFQRRLFDTVRELCGSVTPEDLRLFPPELAAFVTSLQKDCARLEVALNDQVERARQIFTEVAGPIESLPVSPQRLPRPWLKPAAELFLTIGRWLWAV